ncbi:amino acid ABC transporter substrate-binding protein [Spirochaetia bacterium]|nr:amino acid ABC transporter substrate-binding protein [Spirochaetia bacterium]
MKKLLLVAMTATLAVTAFGASQADKGPKMGEIERIKKAGVLRVGVFSDEYPFGWVDNNGVYQGYDVYFARRIAKEILGDENAIEFVAMEPAARVESLQSNKIDIQLANFTVTPARAEVVDFTLPYQKVSIGIVSPDSAPITDIRQLEGKNLIVDKGTTQETYFTENYPKINLVKYDLISAGFAALKDGRADARAQDNTIVFAWATQNPGYTATITSIGSADYIAAAVRKGNKELLDYVNNLIVNVLEDDFFHKNYAATLLPVFGPGVDPESVVVEHGKGN